jgi:hypothetical protein
MESVEAGTKGGLVKNLDVTDKLCIYKHACERLKGCCGVMICYN